MKKITLGLLISLSILAGPLKSFSQEAALFKAIARLFEEEGSIATREVEATYAARIAAENASHFGSAYSTTSSAYTTAAMDALHRESSLRSTIEFKPSTIYKNPGKYGVSMVGLSNSASSTNKVKRIYHVDNNLFAVNNDHLSDVFSVLVENDKVKLVNSEFHEAVSNTEIEKQLTLSIQSFQKSHNLMPTGKVDAATYRMFVKSTARDYALQKELISVNPTSTLDNRLNVLAFQKINKLPPSGSLDNKTSTFIFDKVVNDCKKAKMLSSVDPGYSLNSISMASFSSGFGNFERGANFEYYHFLKRDNNGFVYSYDGNTNWSKIEDQPTSTILDELYHSKYIPGNKVISQQNLYKAIYKYKIDQNLSITHGLKTWLNDQKEFKDITALLTDRANEIIDCKRLINEIDGTRFLNNDLISDRFKQHLNAHYPDAVDIMKPNTRRRLLEKLQPGYYKKILEDPVRSSINNLDHFLDYQYNTQDRKWIGFFAAGENEKYYIASDPLLKDPIVVIKKTGSDYVLVKDKETVLKAYTTEMSDKINSYSIDDKAFIYVNPLLSDPNKVVISFNDQNLEIPMTDFINLTSGQSCSKPTKDAFGKFSQALTGKKVVLYNQPALLQWSNQKFTQNKILSTFGFQVDDAGLYTILRKNLGINDVYLGKDLVNSSRSIPGQAISVKNYTLVIPSQQLHVTDFGVNSLLKKTLQPDKVTQDIGATIAGDVVLTVGHKDAAYLSFIKQISDQEGFKDKIWISYSCFESGDPYLATNVIKDAHAKAVIYFGDKIHPLAAQKLIKNFHGLGASSEEEFINNLKAAIEKTIKENKILEPELRKFENSIIIQISFNYQYQPSKYATLS